MLEAFAALLPPRERLAVSERLSLDAMRGTWLLCALQLVGGAVLWGAGFVAAGQARLESVAGHYTRGASAPSDAGVRRAYGAAPEGLLFLAYALTPQGLMLEYAFLTGLLRALHAAANQKPLGDPLLVLLFAGLRATRAAPGEPRREPERPPAPVRYEAPARAVSAPSAPTTGRQRFTIDDGEEARLTPEGPSAAAIDSLGPLPLRARSAALGVHHRPEFPGTCVVLDGARYEVVEEQPLAAGYRYLLAPWQDENVHRDSVAYGPELVRQAQQERTRALERERAARWSSLLYPFVGLLPEERQLLSCDRLGLDAEIATIAGAGLEIGAALALGLSFPGFAVLVVAPALWRLLGALAFREVAGSPLVAAACLAWDGLVGTRGRRADTSLLPLTREAFWARLLQPDRHEPQPDGSLIVRSLLPHLSWTGGATLLRVGEDHWKVLPLPSAVEQGRLIHACQLWPARDPGMLAGLPEPRPPDPRQYQDEVQEQVAREWDDVFAAAPWLPPLLPRAAQERAFRGRGGAAASLRFTVLTAAATLALAAWFLTGRGPVNLLAGAACAVEGGWRIWRALQGGYAPSLVGLALSGTLRPERAAYQAHLEAERRVLRVLRGREG